MKRHSRELQRTQSQLAYLAGQAWDGSIPSQKPVRVAGYHLRVIRKARYDDGFKEMNRRLTQAAADGTVENISARRNTVTIYDSCRRELPLSVVEQDNDAITRSLIGAIPGLAVPLEVPVEGVHRFGDSRRPFIGLRLASTVLSEQYQAMLQVLESMLDEPVRPTGEFMPHISVARAFSPARGAALQATVTGSRPQSVRLMPAQVVLAPVVTGGSPSVV